MKTLEYTDEATFLTETIEVSDEHYNICENIHNNFKNLNCSPIMVYHDKESLVFCVNNTKDRIKNEKGEGTYQVIIKKL